MAEQTWTISAIPAGALVGNPRSIFEVGADEISNERVIADLAGANYAIYPTNLQYFTGGFGTTLSLDLSSTPAGNSQVSDEMSATFERQGVITITIGGHELTLTIGTDTNRDTGEPYSWTLTSAARTRGNAWLAQLSVGDTGTFTLSDGVTSTDRVISTAGTPEWDFETTEPTVTVRTARHIIASAGTPEWDFETTEPTVTHRTTRHVIATAGTPEWDFETTEPSVTHRTTRHTIASAGTPEWDFETTEPSVTLTAAAPVTTTEHAYRLAQTLEATDLPSSTAEAVPTGWSATEPARTATESVYRISSDVTRLRGVFVSRTAWAWSPAFSSQPYRRSIDSLSRFIRKFVTDVRHKDSGAQASVVVAIQADPPEGIGYRELTIYQTVTLAANAPAAPAAPEWDGTTLSAIGSWSVTFPTYDPNTHRVACAIVLVSTENTAEVIGAVAFCESPGDLNAVFVRSETQPTRLTDSATRLPDNTYDTQGNVPAGDGHIYVAIGNRPPSGTTWTWSAWDQLEGTDGRDGRDGAPGASGIAQRFAVNLGTALPDNNSEIRLRNGATNIDSLTDANAADVDTIQVGISTGTAEATVRRRRGYGGLGGADVVTVREAADQGGNSKFVDYEVTAVSPSPLTGTTRTATLTVSHIEHRLPSAIEGTAVFGISRSLDGIDGIPGTRGLVGYAKSLTRSTRAANAGAVNSATEWFLSGSTANWTGNRTLTVGVSAAEEAELRRVGIGALLTAYDDSDNWADYTLRSAATFTGTGATRAAALSLAHREGFGSPPTTGAVELHYTPAGQDGEDGVSTALVTIWKRSATQPTDTPADGATYTYATGALTGTLNSWVAGTPPAGTNRLWARVASVRGRTATATIDASDWSGVVHDEGADGISTANVTIYQRADAQPTAPARSVRHTFATGANVWTGAGAQNGWQLNIAGTSTQTGTKLWIAHAAAAGDGATDDIASSEWSVGQLAEKGDKGDPGTAGGLNTVYRRAATQPATPTAGTADIPTSWADDPPTGTAQLWASNGSENPDTNVWTWQDPVKAFERTDAPTVAIAVTGDDVRVTVTDPTDTTGIIGHRIDLERLEGGDWKTVDSITHVGLTTNVGRGKTFANVEAGQYRAEVQTAVSPGFIESAYVVSSTVTAVAAADTTPGATAAPTLSFSGGFLQVSYADPANTGNSPLTNFDIDVRKDGTATANRAFVDTHGVLQGRSVVFTITESGTYYARTRANNANGKGAWGPFSSGRRVTISSAGGVSRVPAPINVAISVTGDDIRVVWYDPSSTTGVGGYGLDLEKSEEQQGEWLVTTSVETSGLTGSSGAGRSFANVSPGRYRVRLRSIASSDGAVDSEYVYSDEVFATESGDLAPAVPAAPVLSVNVSRNLIQASFTAPDDNGSPIVGYHFRVYLDGRTDAHLVATVGHGVRQGSMFEYTAGEAGTYYMTVAARNANGTSAFSAFSSSAVLGAITDSALTAPNTVEASAGDTVVTLAASITGVVTSWEYRTSTSLGGVTSEGWTTIPSSASSSIAYDITGLTNGEEQFYQLRAVNSQGTGDPSEIVSAVPGSQTSGEVPPPTSITGTENNSVVTFTWAKASGISDSAIVYEYWLEYSLTGRSTAWTRTVASGDIPGSDTQFTTGRLSGGWYRLRMRTRRLSDSHFSVTTVSAGLAITSTPGEPDSESASGGNRTVTLRAAASGTITKWQYKQATTEAALTSASWVDISSTDTIVEHTITGLTNGQIYYFIIRAVGPAGEGPDSDVVSATPSNVAAPANVSAQKLNENAIEWSWPAATGFVEGTYQYVDELQKSVNGVWELFAADSTYHIPEQRTINRQILEAGTYRLRMRVWNGAGAWSSSVYSPSIVLTGAMTVPAPPKNFGFWDGGAPTVSRVNLAWQNIFARNGGSPVTHREYRQGTSQAAVNSATWIEEETETFNRLRIMRLGPFTAGNTYYFQVREVNAIGDGGTSDTVSVSFSGTPSAPRNVSYSVRRIDRQDGTASGEVSAIFTVPASDGGSPILRYEVEYTRADINLTRVRSVQGLVSPAPFNVTWPSTDFPLTNVKLRAVNSSGAGEWSPEVTVPFPSA